MAASMNKAFLIGNLGRDPELRETRAGTPVANFSIATNETWKGPNGEPKKRTEWHKIVAFGRLAEVAKDHLRKGSQVMVEGRMQRKEWEDSDGIQRFDTEIKATQILFLKNIKSQGDEEYGYEDEASVVEDDDLENVFVSD